MVNKKYLLGLDIGSSSVKAALVDADTGKAIASAQAPDFEMPIHAQEPGWAEQSPICWWDHCKDAIEKIQALGFQKDSIVAIGISYQMHGLVIVDKNLNPLRASIIWCDSRSVEIGETAFEQMGKEKALSTVLNSPGNFTAAKLAWVKQNEPELYQQIYKIMLPGDFIASKLTGEVNTTTGGLSEGILWDFKNNTPSEEVIKALDLDSRLLPDLVPAIGHQGTVSHQASLETGLPAGIPVTYRAGDQPNNALSLNVFEPGELAATAGTSGVIYGILDRIVPDPAGRVNLFAHVNHTKEITRLGVLLCVNGTGIQYSWLRNQLFGQEISYSDMNKWAEAVGPGADNLRIFPFGNGVERLLQNQDYGGKILNLDFNRHSKSHLVRAAQEGIIFALNYGFETMREMGVKTNVVKAGSANMFLSNLFAQIFASVTNTHVELYDTDGATGAARAAGIGAGIFSNSQEAFSALKKIKEIQPDTNLIKIYEDIYGEWKNELENQLNLR
ncbi:MAG: carbohydrate kinase [Bacteroidales bacterium]|nr:carbohydrate kinase [Bacteroidales bacterium]